jgi:hypothetical protein
VTSNLRVRYIAHVGEMGAQGMWDGFVTSIVRPTKTGYCHNPHLRRPDRNSPSESDDFGDRVRRRGEATQLTFGRPDIFCWQAVRNRRTIDVLAREMLIVPGDANSLSGEQRVRRHGLDWQTNQADQYYR